MEIPWAAYRRDMRMGERELFRRQIMHRIPYAAAARTWRQQQRRTARMAHQLAFTPTVRAIPAAARRRGVLVSNMS